MATAVLAPPKFRNVAEVLAHLGEIPPERVLLNAVPLGRATEADVLALHRTEKRLCELIDGVLVEKPVGYTESYLALIIAGILNAFVRPRRLGVVSGEAGMIRLIPGLLLIPDVAFASWERFPDHRLPLEPIPDLVPDLAVEVLSKCNTAKEMDLKRRRYFAAGTRLVWIVDPKKRTVQVYTAPDRSVTLGPSDTLDGGDVLPGFMLPLPDLFAELDRGAED